MIEEGRYLLLYGGSKAQYLLKYQKDKKFSTHLGEVILPEALDFGDSILSSSGKEFYVLLPSTVDISMKVRRTTTIIYPKDAGIMILETGIGASSRVLEIGTGSGAFTIVLAKIVGEKGKVYSFERREEFLQNARRNIENAGLIDSVELFLLDPALADPPLGDLDAAFIDSAEPWRVVRSVWNVLKPGATWCSISPNIEQVQKTFKELENGFTRRRCIETFHRYILVREGKTRPRERMVSHTGYIVFANKIKIRP